MEGIDPQMMIRYVYMYCFNHLCSAFKVSVFLLLADFRMFKSTGSTV
jgi:hypothetical protein